MRPHADLGLLSFCIEDEPGLELQDCVNGKWVRPDPHAVIIFAGEALTATTGRAYLPGVHRVIAGERPRTSQVFHLRMRRDAWLDTERLATPPELGPGRVTATEFLNRQLASGPGVNQPAK